METRDNTKLLLIYFLVARIWLSYISNFPVGVDAWDYLTWIKLSVIEEELLHAPLHVPGFYALLSTIAVYTEIEPLTLYTFVFPLLGGISLYKLSLPIMNRWAIFISSAYGFYVLRTSMIIPEWLGLMLIPITIYSLRQYSATSRIVYLILSNVFVISIILSHHLSGGIILSVVLYWSLYYKDTKLLGSALINSIVAFFAWSIAGGFPIQLVLLVFSNYGFVILPVIAILIIILHYNKIPEINNRSLIILWYVQPLIPIILFFIGISVNLNTWNLLYWLPAYLIFPIAIKANKDDNELSNLWIFSMLGISLSIVLFPIIRPLLARILVFNIQSFIPFAGIYLGVLVDKIYESYTYKSIFVIIIGILLLTSFHSYPNENAWFNTEFRYYHEEIETAALYGKFNSDVIPDTDNRFGVMYRGLTTYNSTYGEFEESWLTQSLRVKLQPIVPNNYSAVICDTVRNVGFMTGKFIHGQGGGGNDVSVDFDPVVENYLNHYLSQPVKIGTCKIWMK